MAISSRNFYNNKQYEVRLFRERQYVGNLGKLAREISWTVNRNPAIGYNELSFKVDQLAFTKWCEGLGVDTETIIKPIKTDCQIWVKSDPESTAVCVAHGYLDAYPSIEQNGDAYDYKFAFHDQFLKLQYASRIPNGTNYSKQYADDVVSDLIIKAQERQGTATYGFTRGDTARLAKIDRTYTDWKPVSEAIADMLDNQTGAGKFDVWIDENYRWNIAKPRGDVSGYLFTYPYNPASGEIPMSAMPTYSEAPELGTLFLAVGSGQGDAAISTLSRDDSAIAEFGYVEQYGQYSSVENQNTLNQKANSELENMLNPQPAPKIAVCGAFIDWNELKVGDTVDYINNVAVGYGVSGVVRIAKIAVNVDSNNVESVTLETEALDGQ